MTKAVLVLLLVAAVLAQEANNLHKRMPEDDRRPDEQRYYNHKQHHKFFKHVGPIIVGAISLVFGICIARKCIRRRRLMRQLRKQQRMMQLPHQQPAYGFPVAHVGSNQPAFYAVSIEQYEQFQRWLHMQQAQQQSPLPQQQAQLQQPFVQQGQPYPCQTFQYPQLNSQQYAVQQPNIRVQ